MPVGVLTVPWAQTREPSPRGRCLCCAAFTPCPAAAIRPPMTHRAVQAVLLRSCLPLVPVPLSEKQIPWGPCCCCFRDEHGCGSSTVRLPGWPWVTRSHGSMFVSDGLSLSPVMCREGVCTRVQC